MKKLEDLAKSIQELSPKERLAVAKELGDAFVLYALTDDEVRPDANGNCPEGWYKDGDVCRKNL